jgi:NhaP-type Na+/H+ or K+/H+ antiporter
VTGPLVYFVIGFALLLAVVLPSALRRFPVSSPLILLVVGAAVGALPLPRDFSVSPIVHREFVEHLTEFTVIVALMGCGLALDRQLPWRRLSAWRRWSATWRLLGIAMPLGILGVALLGWWAVGLAPAAAVLLGAVLAPTDPVLASDVQVTGPTASEDDPAGLDLDEHDEVRFALTSEAGLNDGLAFPFVYFAVFMVTMGSLSDWGLHWLAWELVGKIVLGVVLGAAVGWALTKVAFRAPRPSLRTAETSEPLLALAAVLLSYGITELIGGYGFLAVFTCALALRSAERGSHYHVHMHGVIERLERLLTLIVLLLLGVALTNGMLDNLTWPAVALAVALIFVIRPLTGLLALAGSTNSCRVGDHALDQRERAAVSFFGVRGVGSLFYLAYATGEADFGNHELLWATVGFTITLSVVVHGIAATPVMDRLDRWRELHLDTPGS